MATEEVAIDRRHAIQLAQISAGVMEAVAGIAVAPEIANLDDEHDETVIRLKEIRNPIAFHPGGMSAISRGLSAATPPERDRSIFDPEGVIATLYLRTISLHSQTAATPPGSWVCRSHSGGIAALNPRLMACIPPG